jgi:carbohydrate-selective porin OprB
MFSLLFFCLRGIAAESNLGNVKVSGNETFVGHNISNYKQNKSNKSNNANSIFNKVSLKFTKELENKDSKIVVGLKAGRGTGIEKTSKLADRITYSKLSNADDTTSNDVILVKLTDLYYQQSSKNFTKAFGKLDCGDFFASNKYTGDKGKQFLTNNLSSDVLIPSTSQNIALYLKYKLSDKVSISSGHFLTNSNVLNDHSLTLLQLGYNGNKVDCNVYSWYGNGYDKNISKDTRGFGVTASKKLNNNISIFGRYGIKDRDSYIGKDRNAKYVWSSGIQLNNLIKCRKNDSIGISVGQVNFDNGKNSPNSKNETVEEVYYRIVLNKYTAISPGIQFISNALNKQNKGTTAIACYLRLQFIF